MAEPLVDEMPTCSLTIIPIGNEVDLQRTVFPVANECWAGLRTLVKGEAISCSKISDKLCVNIFVHQYAVNVSPSVGISIIIMTKKINGSLVIIGFHAKITCQNENLDEFLITHRD